MTKKNLLALVLALTMLMLTAAPSADAAGFTPQGVLVLRFVNIPTDDGIIKIYLYNSKEHFLGTHVRGATLMIKDGKAWMPFPSLNYGDYAYFWFHDANGNTLADKNWLGLPAEPQGYSNDASSLFGTPGYEDAVFAFTPDSDNTHVIDVEKGTTTTMKE